MKKRMLWGPLAAIAALYAIGVALRAADDMRRYNRILAMSDEGTVAQELPGLMIETVKEERAAVTEWMRFLVTFPGDLLRYFRMESL